MVVCVRLSGWDRRIRHRVWTADQLCRYCAAYRHRRTVACHSRIAAGMDETARRWRADDTRAAAFAQTFARTGTRTGLKMGQTYDLEPKQRIEHARN